MPGPNQAQGDREISPVIILPSPETSIPSHPSTPLIAPPGSTRIYYGHAVGNPEQGYRFIRPETKSTTPGSNVPGESGVQTRNDGDARPSISPFSSPPPPPATSPKLLRIEQTGATGVSDPDFRRAASTLMHLFGDNQSQDWLRINLFLTSLALGSGHKRKLPTVSHQPQPSLPTNTNTNTTTQTLVLKPRRPRKQPPYNFAPTIEKIFKGDEEYANYRVRLGTYQSSKEKKRQHEEELVRDSTVGTEQSQQSDGENMESNDSAPPAPKKRKSDPSISKPPAKRRRSVSPKAIMPPPPESKRTTRASAAREAKRNTPATSTGDQDRSDRQDSLLPDSATIHTPTIDEKVLKIEDGESTSDLTSLEDLEQLEDEEEEPEAARSQATKTRRTRASRIKREDTDEDRSSTGRTVSNASTSRRPSARSSKNSRRAKSKSKEGGLDYHRFDVRDKAGRFVKNESQWQQQHQPRQGSSSSWTRDNCPDLDLGINASSEWFLFPGNHNIDFDFIVIDPCNNKYNLDTQHPSSREFTPDSFFESGSGDLGAWLCPSNPPGITSGPAFLPDQVTTSGTGSQNESPSNAILEWNETMSTTAHSDFFGLDLNFGGPAPLTISPEAWAQAQENLSQWTNLSGQSIPTDQNLFPPESSIILPQTFPPSTSAQLLTKSPSIQSTTDGSSCPDIDSVPDLNSTPSTASIKPRNPLSSKSTSTPSTTALSDPSSAKVTKSKEFHFVANSDKKTATRLRNTMTSRNLRQSKVSRIAQLERELEEQRVQAEKWKVRALGLGWSGEE